MQRGISNNKPADAPADEMSPVGRVLGFLLLAGAATASLAGVVLLPAYARTSDAVYDTACIRAEVADAEAQIAANQRLIDALTEGPGRKVDPVLVKRLAMNQSQFWPQYETVVLDPQAAVTAPPDIVTPPRTPRPPRPDNMFIRVADKFESPAKRRGILLLAAAALLAALFLFGPTDLQQRKTGSR